VPDVQSQIESCLLEQRTDLGALEFGVLVVVVRRAYEDVLDESV
jgi:hypothetical protein